MHSRKFANVIFHFDGGLDGGFVRIIDEKRETEIVVKAEDILRLVAEEYVLPKKISQLEQTSYEELLK